MGRLSLSKFQVDDHLLLLLDVCPSPSVLFIVVIDLKGNIQRHVESPTEICVK